MCGIVGATFPIVGTAELNLIRVIILQSKIRGLHATGVSYLQNGIIKTIKESIPADKFLKKYGLEKFIDNGSLHMIAHCRYSTSDLRYNQPLGNAALSIVHNGVVTQELPENWEQLYGYVCDARNDTELLVKTIETGKCVLSEWSNSSLAVVELHNDGTLRAYRNGKRPLYGCKHAGGVIFGSTQDIFCRSGLQPAPSLLECGAYYTVGADHKVSKQMVITHGRDLQGIQA